MLDRDPQKHCDAERLLQPSFAYDVVLPPPKTFFWPTLTSSTVSGCAGPLARLLLLKNSVSFPLPLSKLSQWHIPAWACKLSPGGSQASPDLLQTAWASQNFLELPRSSPTSSPELLSLWIVQDHGKGWVSLRGGAFMTVLAVLTVLESTLPSLCLSYKIQHNEATVAVLTVSAVSAVSVMTVTPLKLNPPFPWAWILRALQRFPSPEVPGPPQNFQKQLDPPEINPSLWESWQPLMTFHDTREGEQPQVSSKSSRFEDSHENGVPFQLKWSDRARWQTRWTFSWWVSPVSPAPVSSLHLAHTLPAPSPPHRCPPWRVATRPLFYLD